MNFTRLPTRFLGVQMSVTMPRLMLMACLLSPTFLWPSSSWALGLGEIHLNSALNEPMNAEIDLIAAAPDELNALRASLAGRRSCAHGQPERCARGRPDHRRHRAAAGSTADRHYLPGRPRRYAHQDRAQLAREYAREAVGHRSNHVGGVSRQSRCVRREYQHFTARRSVARPGRG